VLVNFTTDTALLQQYNPQLMNIVEKVTAFRLQTQALDEAAVATSSGTQKLRAAATRLLEMGEMELYQTAQQALQNLQQQGQVGPGRNEKAALRDRETDAEADRRP